MEASVTVYKSKIRLLLEKFVSGKCKTQIDGYLDKLLTHLWLEEKTTCILPIFTEWIVHAITKWSASRLTPQTNIISFTLNLASLLSQNEERFNELNRNNFFIKLVNVTKAKQPKADSSVKLAYIKLLSSFLDHSSGVEWMIACTFWEDIFNLSLKSDNEHVIHASSQFMAKVLEKSVDFDEDFCDNVVKQIMNPLKSVKNISDTDATDDVASQSLQPTLKLICNILEYFLKGIYSKEKNFGVAFIFLKNFHLGEQICDFMILAQNKCLLFELSKTMFIMQFIELYGTIITKTSTPATINTSVGKIRQNFISKMFNGSIEEQLEFCYFGILYWKVVDSKILSLCVTRSKNKLVGFSDELVSFLTMPHMGIVVKYLYMNLPGFEEEYTNDDFRNAYVQNLLNNLSRGFLRVVFFWRDRIIEHPDIFKFSTRCLDVIKESRNYMSKNQGVMVFKTLIYILNDITTAVKKCPEKLDIFIKEPSYVLQMFELVGILIEDFDIMLKDGIEATYVVTVAFEFLALTEWLSNVVVQILKLINIGIAHSMTPNMALLVENNTDSIVTLLGPLLYAKLLNENREVKKATLEVVCTAARMSNNKFPSLQKVLMDSELPTLVVKMSACDGESFVRATAIKCLQEMIQVEEIWNNALKTEDLSQKMRDILLNETEGIVRVEAATFMCVAYEHQQFPKDTLNKVYETMIYSSTTDLHWEVKVRALGFWDKVIKNHLQNQGMIDDSFPNVTFSKEHRKIVTLTDSEIRKRLLKVLSQLSSIGCLGVLMSAIKDDCDMEVSKTAVKITQRLVDLFKKYNVRSDCSAPTSPLPTENGMSATVSMSSGISVDESVDSPASNHPDFNEEIIDQIVNSKDVSLLKNVYAPSDYGSVSNYDIQVRKIVTPNEFLQFTQQDLNNLITEKKNWLNGIEDLGSLLDDMLKTYDDDVNNMDCY